MEITFDFEKPIVDMDKKIEELKKSVQNGDLDLSDQIKDLEKTRNELKQKIYSSLSAWQKVQIARHPQRPYSRDYVDLIFEDFVELSGDRTFGNDQAILCGIAAIDGRSVVVMGHQKGRTLEENMDRNFGMAHPEGYRKAMRIMKLAEKFNRPIITFIDTAGAYPGIAAEERGQAEAIARNLRDMSDLKVPIISVVIGEGGSGGALGIGVSNRILCLENAYYSVISPEGCAAILFRDGSKASQAAQAMKLTAKDLLSLKVIDEIIKEPLGGAHYDYEKTALNIKTSLNKYLSIYEDMTSKKIVDERYLKFRNIGVYEYATKKSNKNKPLKKAKKTSKNNRGGANGISPR
ncbi:MAG: acetyl-CoA carboxylase carboxyltransferase subunit alpha [Endomicrobium sp.]|jgi:acetyl-CoA carboxylase carboxyl transferase subunit alpha|uniref:acetyl-CoA carboxylase carboxyltransferase subunit alpha n=1 Tax=Candidatus Endomicrobiellum cubanum TaxID=3242325 RepID=UPI002827915B|nr:acetyl-CoA carboxylase carboxyltransferase subunit alpha [Endomicrobium sp.]